MARTIVIVSNVYPPNIIGGAEIVAHSQAKEFQNAGNSVHVFCGEADGQPRHSVTSDVFEGIPVNRIHLDLRDYFSSEYVNFFHPEVDQRFSELIDRVQPTIVHVHNAIGLSARILHIAAQRGVPVVLTLHDHWGFCFKNTIIKVENRVCRDFSRCGECQAHISDGRDLNAPIRMRNDYLNLQFRQVSAFISPSHYLAAAYVKAGFPIERMYIVPYGTEVERFARVTKRPRHGKLRFTFIGNVTEHKGARVLMAALPLLRRSESFQLNVVGDGPLRAEFVAYVKRLGLERQVRFWGKVRHDVIECVYEQTDVQVMPSIWPENQPVTITESMAARCAVIASSIGGIPELVEHGKTGYLFRTGDAAELAAAMLDLIAQPCVVDEMGLAAFQKIKNNTLMWQSARILKLYDRLQPIRRPKTGRALVVCSGPRFDERASRALAEIDSRDHARQLSFVMSDWVSPDQARTASLAFVLPGADLDSVLGLMCLRIPIVVPAEMRALADVCHRDAAGLPYETSEEAAECILWLTSNSEVRNELAENACRAASRLIDSTAPML